jgi:hypothetical protein
VDPNRRRTLARTDLAREAESIVRSLAGVASARVHAGHSGIDAIHVDTDDPDTARVLAGHVRSALLAGLATPVLPARIHVRVAHAADDAERTAPIHATAITPVPDDDTAADHTATNGRHLPFLARPRLVSVDLEKRDDGRLLCRVVIAHDAHLHSGEALAVDLPGAAAHAAAQAAVRALDRAGIHGLELAGLRDVEIAGRQYVVVALNRTDTTRRSRSGSAPILGSAERSAAEATVVAVHELM